jgi:hypothetical protein
MLRHITNPIKLFSVGLVALALGAVSSLVQATPLTFNFNSLADNATNAQVQSYMQSLLPTGWTITVTGAFGEKDYTGEDHVVGGTFNGSNHQNFNGNNTKVWSNTLGTSDLGGAQRDPGQSGYLDTFLINNTSINAGTDIDRITMVITAPTESGIDSLSFDYEIFPNGDCPGNSGNGNCSTTPDFTLKADGVQNLHYNASKPSLANDSPLSTSETAWQYLGVSGLINISDSNNQTTLEFIDWPAMIGIDNLVINYHTPPPVGPQSVPEPSSILLVGFGLLSLRSYLSRRKCK